MLDWNEYVSQLITQSSSLDGISLSLGDLSKPVGIPPIIKASIFMLDRMQEKQGKFNILVFPERIQSIFIFTLAKLLYNISEGKIDQAYDPSAFQPGDKLRFGSAVVEFVAIEEKNGNKRMKIRLAEDLTISASVELFPFFQRTNTKKKLSTNKQYVEAKREAERQLLAMTPDEKYLKLLTDHRTHGKNSIVNMTSIINTKALIASCDLCGQSVKNTVLVGQANYEGTVDNIGAGQLVGIPAIVLVSDMYSISAMAQKGHPIQSIIIDGSNANALLSQMDALDELIYDGNAFKATWSNVDSAYRRAKCCAALLCYDEAIQHLERSAELAQAFDNRPEEEKVTSLLLGEQVRRRSDYETADSRPLREILRDSWLADEVFDAIRDTAAFQAVLEQLK